MQRFVQDAHPEIMHYTSAAGLTGIIRSQSLWATHSAFLNDSTEIELFFDTRLAKVLESGIRAELIESPDLRVLPEFAKSPQEADAAIVRYAQDMAEAIRNTTNRFNQPYLVSFCALANSRVRQDGLLSQWRGYGKDGGYALFFDTKGLNDLLTSEVSNYWYQHMQWGDVHYHQDDNDLVDAEPEIIESENTLRHAIRAFIKRPSPEELESTFEPVTTLSCLFKHWGFHEEREVRVIAIPPNAELIQEGRAAGESRTVRSPKTFLRGGTPVPYLELFASAKNGEQATRLPITRILVGPHPQSELRRRAVLEMLEAQGITAEVAVSQIPFVGA
jgi:hypothetical protein